MIKLFSHRNIAVMLAGTALAGTAHAQTAPTPPDTSESAVADIVVTAQRREQRLSEVPISVTAQTGIMLRSANVTDSRALEQVSPAVNFNSSYTPTTTSLSIRGISSLSNEGGIQPSVGVVVDGVPVARQGEFVTDLTDIERVEILSGPQGTLFGKNSTAGVINIVTVLPTLGRLGGSFDLTGTSDEEVIAKGAVNAPIGDRAALRINGYYHYIDPLVKNLGGDDVLGQRSYGGQAKLLFDVGASTDVLLSGSYNRAYSTFGVNFIIDPISGALGDFQRLVFGPVIGQGTDAVNQDTISSNLNKTYAFTGEINSELAPDLKLTAITGYRNYSSYTAIDVDGGPVGVNIGRGFSPNPLGYPIEWVNTGKNHQVEKYNYLSQEVRLAYSGRGFDIIAGAYYQNYNESRDIDLPIVLDGAFALQNPALAGVPFLSNNIYPTRIHDNTAAVFGDITYAVTPTINVFGGLRYTNEKVSLSYHRDDYFNPVAGFFDPVTTINTAPPINTVDFKALRKDNNLSGRIGIQWKPRPNLNYYASYNRGYKGAAADLGRTVTGPSGAIIKPELANAFEIGAKQRFFDNMLSLDISLYHQTVKNIQQTALITGITPTLINAGSLKVKGFEVNATARPTDGLVLNVGVVHNDARYSGDNFFPCGPSVTQRCPNGPAGTQNLNHQRAIANPRWKVVASASYEQPIASDLKLGGRVGYVWRSATQYQLYEDPLTEQPSYGLLDASITLGAIDDHWQVSIFGKNLTDKFYYSNLNTADFFIGRSFGNLGRDFRRYGGLRLSYRY